MKRLCMFAIASAGGHWVQLCRLAPLFEEHDTFYATTLAGAATPTSGRAPFVVPDASRQSPFKFLQLWLKLLVICLRVRPDVVVTTGAAPGLVALQIGKLFGARTIWIDSIANSEELSMSGRLAARFADLWLTQWFHLAGTPPQLRYFGAVL